MTLLEKMAEAVGEQKAGERFSWQCPQFHFERVKWYDCEVDNLELYCWNCWSREWKPENGEYKGGHSIDTAGESE